MATESETQRPSSWQQLLRVSATLLAVGLVISVGAWKMSLHDQHGRSAGLVQRQAPALGNQAPGSRTTGNGAESEIARGASAADRTLRLIVVGSTAQAAPIQQGLAAMDTARYQAGLPPLHTMVQQVADDAQAATVRQMVAHENELLTGAGLPTIQIIDLRADLAGGANQGPGTPPNGTTNPSYGTSGQPAGN